MSRRIYLWIEGAEVGPMEERDVRDQVVKGKIDVWTLARSELSARDSWSAVSELLTQRDRVEDILAHRGEYALENPAPDKVDRIARRVALGLCLVIALLWSLSVAFRPTTWTEREPTRRDAYRSAKAFVMDRLPGAREVASESQAIVNRDGRTWRVAFRVDGLNAFGGPVRCNVAVEMRHNGEKFEFVTLKQ